jgi:hypothetical protein
MLEGHPHQPSRDRRHYQQPGEPFVSGLDPAAGRRVHQAAEDADPLGVEEYQQRQRGGDVQADQKGE